MKYYIMAFRKYADSKGRASRRELIWFFLIHWLVCIVLGVLGGLWGSQTFAVLSALYMLAIICPNVCLQVRRLHDVGKSGAWWLTFAVPILNFYLIYLLVFKRGDPGVNRFGPPVRHGMPSEIAGFQQDRESQGNTYGKSRFCRYCGTELSQGARFCRMCGAGVSEPYGEQIFIDGEKQPW